MRIAVCDDEKPFLDMICKEIEGFWQSLDVLCVPFTDGNSLISAYGKGQRFDAVFLDIEMKGMDGMQTAARLRTFSADVPILFLTGHTEFAMDGYEVGAFRFLQKPVRPEKLRQALIDVKQLCTARATLLLKENGCEYILSPEDIIYAEADNNTVRFVTESREYKVRMRLTEAMQMLEAAADCFCRIHRCSIVHLGHVTSRSDKEIRMDNGSILPVSRSYAAELSSRLMDFVRQSAR